MANYITYFNDMQAYNAAELQFPNVSYVEVDNIVLWKCEAENDAKYLTFTALEDGTFSFYNKLTEHLISYSLDNGSTWTELQPSANTPTVTSGNKILWKGELESWLGGGIGSFASSGRFNVEGNVMSLLYANDYKNKTDLSVFGRSIFSDLFSECKIVSAENLSLPATTLAQECYGMMFNGCTSLISAPQLPATELANYCYAAMFLDCTSLQKAPQLLATTLANYSYNSMFKGCTSLNEVTCLATDISAVNCVDDWLYNVSPSGTFTKAASMQSWQSGFDGIPTNWTVVDAE